MVLTSAVAVAPSLIVAVVEDPGVRPLAAVVTQPDVTDQPWAALPLARLPSAVSEFVGPLPPAVVRSPGVLGIPAIALTAYQNADGMMARIQPKCGISWNLLAGIGYLESTHAFGGATDERGNAVDPIYGPTLDGSLPGNEIIVQSRSNGRAIYARAMGPMQFLPSTWTHYASDGDGDGVADPQNLFDSTLAAARYLCSGGLNLRDRSQMVTAVLRYNHSMPYAQNVLGWSEGYATGVPPVNLPPMTRPTRPIIAVRSVNGPATTGSGPAETVTEKPGNGGNAVRQDGGSASASSLTPRQGSSSVGSGSTSTTGGARHGNRGATKPGNTTSPKVTVGNGRTGGARNTGR
jgi:Transglycosylase SLT domain